MRMPCRPAALALAAIAVGLSLAGRSEAHINLLSPPPRVSGIPDGNLLRGPCAQRNDARVPERVSTFRPGETIDVEWDVYVQHVSYFRISFDADGDDSFSSRASAPSDPADDDLSQLAPGAGELILGYIPDPRAQQDHISERVTLPNLKCDNCTLQITQFTYGLPVKDAVYYQCADLVLEGELMSTPVSPDSSGPTGADAGAQDAPASGAALDPGFVGSGEGCSLTLGSVGSSASTSPDERPSHGSSPRPSGGALLIAAALVAAIARGDRRARAAS